MTDSFFEVSDVTVEERLHQYDDGGKPHRNEFILRFLIEQKAHKLGEVAEILSDTFDYNCSKSMVHRGKEHHDIRDPVNEGTLAAVMEQSDDSEQGQPPSFFLDRSDDNPVHPFDTDCFDESTVFGEGGIIERNAEPSTTARFTPPANSDSHSTSTDTTNSDFDSGTGVYKGPITPTAELQSNEWRVSRSDREHGLVAPPIETLKENSDVPQKYHTCGCGSCSERHFLDGTEGAIDCPFALPVTVAGARRIYQKTEGTRVANNVKGNDVRQAKQQYAKLMKADSAALRDDNHKQKDSGSFGSVNLRYEETTTVLVSLRIDATDSDDRLITPFKQLKDCKDAWQEARSQLPTGDDLHAFFWTIATTDEWASPHVHCYLWYTDSNDQVTEQQFKPTVETFVQTAKYPADAHLNDDGSLVDGTVRVEHDPLLADPTRLNTRVADGGFAGVTGETRGPKRLTDGDDVQSRGAIYVGTNLPKLALKGAETDADTEGAAFLQVCSDSRQTARGNTDFYLLSESLELLSDHESPIRAD